MGKAPAPRKRLPRVSKLQVAIVGHCGSNAPSITGAAAAAKTAAAAKATKLKTAKTAAAKIAAAKARKLAAPEPQGGSPVARNLRSSSPKTGEAAAEEVAKQAAEAQATLGARVRNAMKTVQGAMDFDTGSQTHTAAGIAEALEQYQLGINALTEIIPLIDSKMQPDYYSGCVDRRVDVNKRVQRLEEAQAALELQVAANPSLLCQPSSSSVLLSLLLSFSVFLFQPLPSSI